MPLALNIVIDSSQVHAQMVRTVVSHTIPNSAPVSNAQRPMQAVTVVAVRDVVPTVEIVLVVVAEAEVAEAVAGDVEPVSPTQLTSLTSPLPVKLHMPDTWNSIKQRKQQQQQP